VDDLLASMQADAGEHVDAQERREGLWNAFQRSVAISTDRLWTFVRHLSGALGGEVNEVVVQASESVEKATKAVREQRLQVAKRVADTQSKIVELVVSGMLKESTLSLDRDSSKFVVVDAAARAELRKLAEGSSGKPFFSASVALQNAASKPSEPVELNKLLSSLASTGAIIQQGLERTLASTAEGGGATQLELAQAGNSYFVHFRADALAAARQAHELLRAELQIKGVRAISLWELVEGGCEALALRFAAVVGHLLVQTRASVGVSAMYVGANSIATNALQARVAVQKLANFAAEYARTTPAPDFGAADVEKARGDAMRAGAAACEAAVVGLPVAYGVHAYGPSLPAAISASGWGVVGGRRR